MTADEAIELADILMLRDEPATAGLVAKIRERARPDPLRRETEEVTLDRNEMVVLMEVLNELLEQPGWAEATPAYVHLRDELEREQA
jgi:hypothetical protein